MVIEVVKEVKDMDVVYMDVVVTLNIYKNCKYISSRT